MTNQADHLTVHVRYRDFEETFTGKPEDVWYSINRFFTEFLPSFEIARKMTLNVDFRQLVKDCEGIIGFSQEGPNLLIPRERLTDNETLMLWLLASHVGFQLGKLESEAILKDDLQIKLGKSAKIASTRLGELIKSGIAAKINGEKHRITTFGIVQMRQETLPKVRAKIGT